MTTLAFVGSPTLIDRCVPAATAGIEVIRLPEETRPNAIRAASPHAVVAFEPSPEERELIDAAGLPALIWWESEAPDDIELARPNQRIVAGGPPDGRVWRSVPFPVADSLYAEGSRPEPWKAAWLGSPTSRRADHLAYFKGDAGLIAEESHGMTSIAVNMHDDERPACEHRALCALAQGRLLVSEALKPTRGLEPGIDYIEVDTLDDMFLVAEHAARTPSSFRRRQLRGRRKAELFRASQVIPRLVGDLMLELETR